MRAFGPAAQRRFEKIGLRGGPFQLRLPAADKDRQTIKRLDDDGSRVIAGQFVIARGPETKTRPLIAGHLELHVARLSRFQGRDLRFAGRLTVEIPLRRSPRGNVAGVAHAGRHRERFADRQPRAIHAELFDRRLATGRRSSRRPPH